MPVAPTPTAAPPAPTPREAGAPRPLLTRLAGWALYLPLVLLVVLSAPFLAVSRLLGRPRTPRLGERSWQNAGENQFAISRDVFSPASVAEVVDRVRCAATSTPPRRVRAVGAGHSFSPVALTDDVRLEMRALNAVRPVAQAERAPGWADERLCYVEAGVTIRELNARLDELGLAFPNMGSYDVQTVSGAISTATHGSGAALGALCDAVVSIDIVTATASRVGVTRIERRGGPTAECPPGYELVRDDDAFCAAVVSFGAFGVVVGYTLAVVPAFRLEEARVLRWWSQVKADLERGVFRDPERRHYEVYVNPYPHKKKGDHICLVTERRVTDELPNKRADRTRNPVTSFFASTSASRITADWVAASLPSLMPRLLSAALAGYVDDAYIGKSFEVLHLGDVNKVRAYSSEPALATAAEDGGTAPFIAAVEELFEIARTQAERGRRFTSPMSLRFVRASPHFLAPMYGRETCSIELPMLMDTRGGWETLCLVERRLHGLGARPHWGQAHWYLGPDRLAALYPRWRDWMAQCRRFNPLGVFDSLVTEMMGLRSCGAPPVDDAETTAEVGEA